MQGGRRFIRQEQLDCSWQRVGEREPVRVWGAGCAPIKGMAHSMQGSVSQAGTVIPVNVCSDSD